MKKLYFTFTLVVLAISLSVAQIGYSFWQFLPLDYETNPYPRQEVSVLKIADEVVTSANSLSELWADVEPDFINPIEGWVNGGSVNDFTTGGSVATEIPAQTPEDFTGNYTLMAGDDALYVLYNVIDDEVDLAEDFVELAFAPYADRYDPGREIYADQSRDGFSGYWWAEESSHVWGWDSEAMAPFSWATVIPGETYVDMSKYGSWTEAGAYKIDVKLESNAENFAPALVYSLKGPNQDTLGDVSSSNLPIAIQNVYEPTSDGYLFAVIVPWELMNGQKLENAGDQMSIAPKVNDYDSDNFMFQEEDGTVVTQRYDYFGSTDNNNVYWAIAYYGAVATLVDFSSTYKPVNDVIEVYYANDFLFVSKASGDYTTEIVDLNGRTVKIFNNESNLDVSFLDAGFYVANTTDAQGNRSLLKFIKQ